MFFSCHSYNGVGTRDGTKDAVCSQMNPEKNKTDIRSSLTGAPAWHISVPKSGPFLFKYFRQFVCPIVRNPTQWLGKRMDFSATNIYDLESSTPIFVGKMPGNRWVIMNVAHTKIKTLRIVRRYTM